VVVNGILFHTRTGAMTRPGGAAGALGTKIHRLTDAAVWSPG
jgi:hypothetical protein